jgi:hypothetical protein
VTYKYVINQNLTWIYLTTKLNFPTISLRLNLFTPPGSSKPWVNKTTALTSKENKWVQLTRYFILGLRLHRGSPSKFLQDVDMDLESMNSCWRWQSQSLALGIGHPCIGFFFSDRLFGGLLVTCLATNRSQQLDDYVMMMMSRSRSTSDQSPRILTLSIIRVMKITEATCQWESRSRPLHSLVQNSRSSSAGFQFSKGLPKVVYNHISDTRKIPQYVVSRRIAMGYSCRPSGSLWFWIIGTLKNWKSSLQK